MDELGPGFRERESTSILALMALSNDGEEEGEKPTRTGNKLPLPRCGRPQSRQSRKEDENFPWTTSPIENRKSELGRGMIFLSPPRDKKESRVTTGMSSGKKTPPISSGGESVHLLRRSATPEDAADAKGKGRKRGEHLIDAIQEGGGLLSIKRECQRVVLRLYVRKLL